MACEKAMHGGGGGSSVMVVRSRMLRRMREQHMAQIPGTMLEIILQTPEFAWIDGELVYKDSRVIGSKQLTAVA